MKNWQHLNWRTQLSLSKQNQGKNNKIVKQIGGYKYKKIRRGMRFRKREKEGQRLTERAREKERGREREKE